MHPIHPRLVAAKSGCGAAVLQAVDAYFVLLALAQFDIPGGEFYENAEDFEEAHSTVFERLNPIVRWVPLPHTLMHL